MSGPPNILLVHLYSNGDCLYATAVARQIKEDYQGCKLTWAIAGYCRAIIANNPYVDDVMEINTVKKNDVQAFRKLKRELSALKTTGKFDEVFITHNMDTNLAYYDGSIRSMVLRAYEKPITVPVQPVLKLYDEEKQKAADFAMRHDLQGYKNVILFEFAPQSRQLNITIQFSLSVAERLATDDTAVILSSAIKIEHPNKNIIDGSSLTFRETAALTHFCTLLLGCSSGITWISTSNAAKQLKMVQLVNPGTTFLNSIAHDFRIFGLEENMVIELTELKEDIVEQTVKEAMIDFEQARKKYHSVYPIHFKTTRKIVYNLLCYFEFGAIAKHIRVNREVYGNRFAFYKELVTGIILSPFTLLINIFNKKILGKKE